MTEDGTIVESDARTPAPGTAAGPVDLIDGAIASASVPMVFPPHPMADDDYVDGGVIEIIPVGPRPGWGRRGSSPSWPCRSRLARDERDYAAAPAGYIGLRSLGMIGVAERQLSNLAVRLPEGSTLTTIDPLVDVVGLFEVEPGLLRINKDYGWLRAADVLAEGDAGIRADIAEGTHVIVGGPPEAWRLEESLWPARQRVTAPARSRSCESRRKRSVARRTTQASRLPGARRLRDVVGRRRGPHRGSTGRPAPSPSEPSPADPTRGAAVAPTGGSSDGRPSEPAPAPEHHDEQDDGRQFDPDPEHVEAPRGRHAHTDQVGEVLPKKPVRKLSGRKMVAMMVSCFITTLRRFDTVERCVSMTLVSRSR